MEDIPVDVLRFISTKFLEDHDRLSLAQTCHRWRLIAYVDVSPVLFDTYFEAPGFFRSPNGYFTCVVEKNDHDPTRLGILATTDPYTFIREWLAVPLAKKNAEFRYDCMSATVVQVRSWHNDFIVALKCILVCQHKDCPRLCKRILAANGYHLVRRSVWYARVDVLCFLLDKGDIHPDVNGGTALRLALGTLGYEHSEDQVARIVDELLQRGADPLRHNLWGIRLCLQRNFFVVAALLCIYAAKQENALLKKLVHELYTQGNLEQAFLVKMSMDEAHAFFSFA